MTLAGSYINNAKYAELVRIAEANNITVAGLCRKAFDAMIESPAIVGLKHPPKPEISKP